MTPPRRWPTHAEEARMDAIANAARIRRTLEPLLDRTDSITTAEIIRRTAKAFALAAEIETILNSVRPGK